MNETLDEQSRQALIQYRIDRADETMREAEVMLRENFFNAAINRLYYACYYATVALLLKAKVNANTHAGVKTMLGLHFISKGIIPQKFGKMFQILFDSRHSSDYEDFVYCDKEMVDEYLPKAKDYLATVKSLLTSM